MEHIHSMILNFKTECQVHELRHEYPNTQSAFTWITQRFNFNNKFVSSFFFKLFPFSLFQSTNLFMRVKWHCYFFFKWTHTEPVGAKAPTFQSDSKGSIFVRHEHTSFAMLCQCQASPLPLIRYVVVQRKKKQQLVMDACIVKWCSN